MIPKPQSRLFVHNCIVGERNMFIDMHLVNNEIAMKSYKYLNCCSKQITKYTNSTHLEIDSFSDSFLSSKKLLTGSIFHRGKWLFLLQIKEWEDMSGQSCNSIKVRPFSKGSNKKKSRTKVFYSMHHFPTTYLVYVFTFWVPKKSRPKFSHLSFHFVLLFLNNS